MWRVLSPEMDKIRERTGCKVNVLDNSIGKGSLIQFAHPDLHKVAGFDVHAESIDALSVALDSAGIEYDLLCADMATICSDWRAYHPAAGRAGRRCRPAPE